jgi:glycerophosphoryl diester phosphodiesterase
VLISAHAGYPRWLRCGADFIEIDVRRDHRGVIVDSHDEAKPGEKHATYDEIVERAAGLIGLHLDLKEPGFEIELVSRALQRLTPDKVVVTPDSESSARTIKEHFPGIRVSPIDFVTLDQQNPIPPDGKPIWIWTVDDEKWMRQLIDNPRIECLITNRPDLALKLRRARS